VIDGMAMDLEQARYVDFAALELYCHRVAGVVGLMSAEIFGYTDPRTKGYARDLGIAFQLTNICRDVGEDARRGRVYLPQEDLARFGVAPSSLLLSGADDLRSNRLAEIDVAAARLGVRLVVANGEVFLVVVSGEEVVFLIKDRRGAFLAVARTGLFLRQHALEFPFLLEEGGLGQVQFGDVPAAGEGEGDHYGALVWRGQFGGRNLVQRHQRV